MARLIRTEKEVEGRFEEVWIVVEEDPLEQWPEGPLAVVGRPAPRKDGHAARARRGALHRRPQAAGDAPRGRPPLAVTRMREVRRIDLAPALALPGRARGDRPGRGARARGGGGLLRRGRRRRRGRHLPPGARRGRGDRGRVGGARGRARSRTTPSGAGSSPTPSRAATSAATSSARSPRPTSSSRPTYRTQTVLHNSLETHQAMCEWQGDVLHVYISTQFIWGIRAGGRRHARAARGQGARRLRVHGRRLRLEERPRRVHVRRRRAREADGAAGALRAHAARGAHLRRQPQRDDPAAPGRRPQRRDDRRASTASSRTPSAGRAGTPRPKGRCRCSTTARTSAPSRTARSSTRRR